MPDEVLIESLLTDREDSPEPLRELVTLVESLRPLRDDSPEHLRCWEGSRGVMTVVGSRRNHRRARSDRKLLMGVESRRDLGCLLPESAEDSRRFLRAATVDESVVELRPHERLLAMSARVSRRCNCESLIREPLVLPPKSLIMSVNWAAKELLRRLVTLPVTLNAKIRNNST